MSKVTAIAVRAFPEKPDLDFILNRENLSEVTPFPLDKLGKFWSGYIRDHAGDELPRDFYAMSLLGTVSGLIGNGREAAMPSPSTFTQPATLWMINVGQPSSGKSPAIKPFQRILTKIESTIDGTIKVDDATIAGTIDVHQENTNGIIVMNDELSGWWSSFKHDRQGEQFWLKAWNGDMPYVVRRKRSLIEIDRLNIAVVGGTQPATLSTMIEATGNVERGFVSRCMFSYPDKPSGQVATGNFPDDDAAYHILENIFYLVKQEETVKLPVDKRAADFHKQWWTDTQEAMWIDPSRPEGQWLLKQRGTAIRLALVLEILWHVSGGASTSDAKVMKRAQDLAASADPNRNSNANERENAREMLRKLCAENGLDADDLKPRPSHNLGGPASVGIAAMKAACGLIDDYFYPHFMRCENFAYQPVNEEAASKLVTALAKYGVEEFNAREMRQYSLGGQRVGCIHPSLHGNKATVRVAEVCEFLEERHIIRRAPQIGTGRPSVSYEVNSLLKPLAKRLVRR